METKCTVLLLKHWLLSQVYTMNSRKKWQLSPVWLCWKLSISVQFQYCTSIHFPANVSLLIKKVISFCFHSQRPASLVSRHQRSFASFSLLGESTHFFSSTPSIPPCAEMESHWTPRAKSNCNGTCLQGFPLLYQLIALILGIRCEHDLWQKTISRTRKLLHLNLREGAIQVTWI